MKSIYGPKNHENMKAANFILLSKLFYFDPHLERPQMVKQAFLALPFSGVQLEWAQVTVVVLVLPLGNLYLML